MFHLVKDMHTVSAAAFFKAAGNTLVGHAVKAARNQVLAEKRLALPWDDNIPGLDQRNEQDNNARGDRELRQKALGTETESNALGLPVIPTAAERCAILVGLVEYVRDECQAYSSAVFDQPNTYENYIKFMASNDKPFEATEAEKTKQQAMIDLGLVTEEDFQMERHSQLQRLSQPYKQYGGEILQTVLKFENAVTTENQQPDDSWFEKLPYWEQLQIIEQTADSMEKIAKRNAVQSVRPRFGTGVDTEELAANAVLIKKEVELIRKYRVEFYKTHKHELELETQARDARRQIPGT